MANKQFEDPQALAQQLMQAANSLTDEEASQRYQQILAQLPPDQATELNTLALSQVQSGDRRQLATQFRQAHQDPNSPFDGYDYDDDDQAAQPTSLGRMSVRAQQQDPSLFGGLLGNNSGLGGQIGKAALAALAAMLLRQVMNNQGQTQGQPAGGGLGSILGGLLGGATGGQGAPQASDPLGSILGGLLGGAMGGQSVPQQRQPVPQGGDLGSILGGLLGGGASTQHVPQRGGTDLGSILGSILGGGNAQPTQQPRGTSGSHRKEGLRVGGEE